MSVFYELDCGGETVTLEVTKDKQVIFNDWDEETELAAIELGFEASLCFEIFEVLRGYNTDNIGVSYEVARAIHRGIIEDDVEIIAPLVFIGSGITNRFFVDRRVNADSYSYQWGTFLHAAAQYGRDKIIDELVGAGATVDITDVDSRTPLILAIRWEAINAARSLIFHGADVNIRDNRGFTPLHMAASRGNEVLAELLLDHGADVCAVDKYGGWTPLDQAMHSHWSSGDKSKHAAIIELLRSKGTCEQKEQ